MTDNKIVFSAFLLSLTAYGCVITSEEEAEDSGSGGAAPYEPLGQAGISDDAGPQWPNELPRDECACELDLSSVEETGSYLPFSSEDVTLIPGYGIYDRYCDFSSASSEGGLVDLRFDCDPESSSSGETRIIYTRQAWFSVRRTFAALQDLSCCSEITFEIKSSGAQVGCPCSDDASLLLESCCFGGSGLTKEAILRFTLVDVAEAGYGNDIREELWWYDFPVDTLGESFDWTTMHVPLDAFEPGIRYNNDELDIENILAIEVNVITTVQMHGGMSCTASGCTLIDNYAQARLIGNLSFRNIQTVCE